MQARTWWLLLALLTIVTVARVATTHRVFSPTIDEPWHVIAGYDVLTKWTFTADLHHPPLARVFFALPFVRVPEPPPGDVQQRGNALLAHDGRIAANIARARMGNLLFLAIGIIAVALWARHLVSPAAGLIAALLFASLPPVLAHAGLATTDMSVAAMLPLALYALTLFLERSSWTRTLLLGVAIAAGMLAKYSFLLYFPATALALLIVRRRIPNARIFISAIVAFVLVWAAYGFTFGTLADADTRASPFATQIFGGDRMTRIAMPAPLYAMGVLEVKHHDREGHRAFLFGRMRQNGWWYYFPLTIFFKTPIPFLILAILGCARQRNLEVTAIAAAILAVAMTSHLNMGVRHVLPIYAPLSIAAAHAALDMRRVVSAALLAWLVLGSALAHPDYLPWFNAFAGAHPERVLNDSNLDWGQDVFRLVRCTREHHLESITLSLATTAPLEKLGLPPFTIVNPAIPLHGAVAVSEFNFALGRTYSPELRAWIEKTFPETKPYRRIGKSIRLYQFD